MGPEVRGEDRTPRPSLHLTRTGLGGPLYPEPLIPVGTQIFEEGSSRVDEGSGICPPDLVPTPSGVRRGCGDEGGTYRLCKDVDSTLLPVEAEVGPLVCKGDTGRKKGVS